jgi:outer membrane receptor for ferric coprogen and ferric-rhodotorulic acid
MEYRSPERAVRPLRSSMSHLVFLACLSIGAAAQSSDVLAQETPARTATRQYDIAAGPLDQALNLFALKAGILLSMDASLTAGKQSPGLSGSYDVTAALVHLLSTSGLEAVPRGGNQYVLRPATAATAPAESALPQVTVVEQSERSATTEGSGSYAALGVSSTATGLALSTHETPQSISVVTQQQMRDRNMQSLDDVADATSGVTYTKLGTERSTYYSRGFPITDLLVDGMSTSVAESYSADAMSLNNMAIYDRVEIVRGANGLLQGSGNPSAVVNLIRKRPTREFQMSAEVGAGSWSDYRTQVDVSGPLNEAGTLRGRAVLFGNDANSFHTGAGTENKMLYAIGEADLSAATTASLGFSVQKDNHKGYDWGGLNTRADGSFYNLDRSASLAGAWAHLNRDNYTLFGDVTHRFDNGWNLTAAANFVRSESSLLGSYPVRVSGDTFRTSAVDAEYTDTQAAFNIKASGPYTLFGRQHELMLAASSRKDRFDYDVYTAANSYSFNITNVDFWAIESPRLNSTATRYTLERTEQGVVVATRLRATDDLSVIVGSRVSWSDYVSHSPSTSASYNSGRQLIPYAGVVYDLTRAHALYASYTGIYSIQQYYSQTGLLAPVQGKNYEIGTKSRFFDGRLNTAVALFQTDQLNLPVALSVASTCGLTGTSRCYTEGAQVRNRGVDLEVSGALTEDWNFAAGFTYSNPEYAAGPNNGTAYQTTVPRKSFKVSTDYLLPGGKWRVGGGLQSQSPIYYASSSVNVRQGGYSLVNLHSSYQFNRNLRLQVNVRNLFDKYYYQSIPSNNNYGGLYYGSPRSVAVTLRYDY